MTQPTDLAWSGSREALPDEALTDLSSEPLHPLNMRCRPCGGKGYQETAGKRERCPHCGSLGQLARPLTAFEQGRTAKIPLDPDALRYLLALPDGYRVERVWMEHDPMRLLVQVSSLDLDVVERGTESPYLDGHWNRHQVLVDDLLWTRWGWEPGKGTHHVVRRASYEARASDDGWTRQPNAGPDGDLLVFAYQEPGEALVSPARVQVGLTAEQAAGLRRVIDEALS